MVAIYKGYLQDIAAALAALQQEQQQQQQQHEQQQQQQEQQEQQVQQQPVSPVQSGSPPLALPSPQALGPAREVLDFLACVATYLPVTFRRVLAHNLETMCETFGG